MTDEKQPKATSRPLAAPVILLLISVTHLAYEPVADLRGMPILAPALATSLLLAGGYALTAWLARRERGFATAANLIVGEDLGVLAAGLLLGYPWADYLRPGAIPIVALQLSLAFAEIVRRQEAGRSILPATRLAWFVVLYALALTAYAVLEPHGLWRPADLSAG
jgi:hypothetical protein